MLKLVNFEIWSVVVVVALSEPIKGWQKALFMTGPNRLRKSLGTHFFSNSGGKDH